MNNQAKRLAKKIRRQYKLWGNPHFVLETSKRVYARRKKEGNRILVNLKDVNYNYSTLISQIISELSKLGISARDSSRYLEKSIDVV